MMRAKLAQGLKHHWRDRLAWGLSLLTPLAVFTLVLATARVSGSSMLPGLKDGDFIVCLRHADVTYGDVVVFREISDSGPGRVLVKRVAGLPGDDIMVADGVLMRNGDAVSEPYLAPGAGAGDDFELTHVPDGCLFVLGDNRDSSMDSRSSQLGCIAVRDVIGKLICKLGGQS